MKFNSWSRWLAVFLAAILMVNVLVCPADAAVKKKVAKVVKKPVPTYKLGLIAPLGNSTGDSMKKGFILAIEQAKAKAGSYAVKYVIADDKDSSSTAVTKCKQLINKDKVQTIIGSSSYVTTVAISEVANAESIPLIAPATTWSGLTGDGETRNAYTFRACFDDWSAGQLAAEYALTGLHAKNAAVFVNKDWNDATSANSSFQSYFEQGGGTIALTREYTDSVADFSNMVKELNGKNVDVIYVAEMKDTDDFQKEIKAQGLSCPVLGPEIWDPSFEIGKGEVLEGTYYLAQCDASDPRGAMKSFVASYKARWKTMPDSDAMLTYDATKMALNAVLKSKSNNPTKIQTALQMMDNFPGVTGPITVDQYGDLTSKPGVIVQIKNGQRMYVTTVTARKFQEPSEPWKDLKDKTVDGMQMIAASYPQLGYALLVPKDWTKITPSDALIYYTPKDNDKVFLTVILNEEIYNILSTNGMEAGLQAIDKMAGMIYEDFKIISRKQITVNGSPGVEMNESFTLKGQHYKCIERVILKNGIGYNIVYKAEASQFDKYEKAMRASLDSVILFVPPSGSNAI